MPYTHRSLVLLLLVMLTAGAHASGQRTTTITTEAIAGYPLIDLDAGTTPEPVLHYVGSTDRWHLLMIVKTSVSSSGRHSADGRPIPGMPWDTVFSYRLPVESLILENAWQLQPAMLDSGITVDPRQCPRVMLQAGERQQALPADDSIRQRCLADR